MDVKLKKLEDQTLVITGASSGIGLTTARMAAERGARLVLAARSEDALRKLTDEINGSGGQAVYVVADVGQADDVRAIARKAEEAFGGFDTWVNNAGVTIYGRLLDVPVEDMRRLFDTNVWGVVHGSLEAVRHLQEHGGALINIGSVLSDASIALQGSYAASKFAVKGFTDALRMELEREGAPVVVTLIKPSAIDTPYTQHARNYMDAAADVPPPVYAPDVVARTILHCAEHPERELFVGAGGKSMATLSHYASGLADTVMATVMADQERKDRPPRRTRSGLDGPSGQLEERGDYDGHVMESSLYTWATLHPGKALLGATAAGLGLAALASRMRS